MTGFDDQPPAGAHRHPDAEPAWAQESFTSYAEWDEPGPQPRGEARDEPGAQAQGDHRGEPWGGEPGSEPPPAAPFADEALRFISSVQDWARRTFAEAQTASHTGPECQWCPLCQFLAVLKGERPDVTERVAEAGAAIASAVRTVVEAAAAGGPAGPTTGRHAHPDSTSEAPRVQRIDLGES